MCGEAGMQKKKKQFFFFLISVFEVKRGGSFFNPSLTKAKMDLFFF